MPANKRSQERRYPELIELYRRLCESKFSFVERGEKTIADVYLAVKSKYAALCRDEIRCRDVCGTQKVQPEWQHRVRSALNAVKSDDGPVRKGDKKRLWKFGNGAA